MGSSASQPEPSRLVDQPIPIRRTVSRHQPEGRDVDHYFDGNQHRTRRSEQHPAAAFDYSEPRRTESRRHPSRNAYDFGEDGYQQPRRISQRPAAAFDSRQNNMSRRSGSRQPQGLDAYYLDDDLEAHGYADQSIPVGDYTYDYEDDFQDRRVSERPATTEDVGQSMPRRTGSRRPVGDDAYHYEDDRQALRYSQRPRAPRPASSSSRRTAPRYPQSRSEREQPADETRYIPEHIKSEVLRRHRNKRRMPNNMDPMEAPSLALSFNARPFGDLDITWIEYASILKEAGLI